MKDLSLDFNNLEVLRHHGFRGFKSIESLWTNKTEIPKEKGVYLVLNPDFMNPTFIFPGVGGFFKGKYPNVSLEELNLNFVDNSFVVYIGKAGSAAGSATLHSRIGQYLSFGQGKNVGHWGGRLIWQLANHKDLMICWKVTNNNDPRNIEKYLLKQYLLQFQKLPFANLNK